MTALQMQGQQCSADSSVLPPSTLSSSPRPSFPSRGGRGACGVVVTGERGAGKAPAQSTHLHRR